MILWKHIIMLVQV